MITFNLCIIINYSYEWSYVCVYIYIYIYTGFHQTEIHLWHWQYPLIKKRERVVLFKEVAVYTKQKWHIFLAIDAIYSKYK